MINKSLRKIFILFIGICLLSLSICCNRNNLYDIISENSSIDISAPLPGNSGTITFSDIGANSLILYWDMALDDLTVQSALQYKGYLSLSNDIDTITNAESNGTEITSGWTPNIDFISATGLSELTTYYFNVIVKDESGNISAYTSMSATTTTYPTILVSNIKANSHIETGFLIGTSSSSTGTVVVVEVRFDGGSYTSATGTTTWKHSFPSGPFTWKNGSQHTIEIRCRDNAGNYSNVISTDVIKGTNKDVNGDGYADVGVGATKYSTATGRAYIYHGSFTGISTMAAASANTIITGESNSDELGSAVAFGDVNGDGYADFIVGAWNYSMGAGNGRAYIFHGSSSGINSSVASSANTILTGEGGCFGSSLAVGDVNGNRYADVAIGAYLYDAGLPGYGRVYIFHGGSSGISSMGAASANTLLTGDSPGDFGTSIAFGDINGDGYADLGAGAPVFNTSQGRVYLFHGGASGISSVTAPSCTTIFTGETTSISLGQSVVFGDVNGDGYADIVMGAPTHTSDQGRIYAFHGSSGGISTPADISVSADTIINGEAATISYFGCSLAIGDVNGDGYLDLGIGAFKFDNNDIGRAYVYLGSSSGLVAIANFAITGGGTFYYMGQGIGFSDINSDGYSDFLVSEWGFSSSRGQFHTFLGSSSGTAAASSATITGENVNDSFGINITP